MNDAHEKEVAERLELKAWAKLLPFLTPNRGRIVFLTLMMAISAGVDALVPLFTRYAVNNFIVTETTEGVWAFMGVYALVLLLQALTTVFYSRHCMIVEMNTGRDLKAACFNHLQRLPLSYYNSSSVGYLLARVMSDTDRISGMIAWGFMFLFWNLFYLVGILVSMFIVNAKMALIVSAVVPFIVIISILFQSRILKANSDVRKANSRITGSFNENVGGAKTSKTLVIEAQNCREFNEISDDMRKASVRTARLGAVYLPIVTFFSSTAVALVLYRSGVLVLSEALDFGVLSAFIAYAIAILEPISQVSSHFTELMATQVNIERVMTLLEQSVDIDDTTEIKATYGDIFNPKPENWPEIKGDIELNGVWFKYPDAPEGDYVLEDVSLRIPAGTTVALVGETGAGKTTLVNLICRFFEPTKGKVLIDGVDYRERSLNWLHSSLGYVQQTPHLFSGSLRENIRYGKLDATDEEIEAAARLVNADKVVDKLEEGWDTNVGEGGSRLSTGEKQLVSFARALIADPPIFVLDEATSSIDTEAEALIQNAISNVLEGRTSFIIAHRLSTIRNADIILLVDERGIVDKGSHDELMAKKGRYYNLYTAMMLKDLSQSEGYDI